jgi:hypothetical protein
VERSFSSTFKSCRLRRYHFFWTFGRINFILVVCTLQMQRHCIHVAFEGGEGVKGTIVKVIIVIL